MGFNSAFKGLNCKRLHLVDCVGHLAGYLLRINSIKMSLPTQANTGHEAVRRAGFHSALPVFESPLLVTTTIRYIYSSVPSLMWPTIHNILYITLYNFFVVCRKPQSTLAHFHVQQ
jgi:hypothetical protein